MFKHKHSILKSGLQLIRIPMPDVKSVTVLAFCNTGSRYETSKEEGIAHFFEHMVFKGTKKYENAQVLAASIDAIGADFNAFTSKEYTGYYVKSASKDIDTSLDVVSDMLLAPLLKEDDIEREKGVIIEEINMYQDTPMRLIGTIFERMAFEGSGLSHDILGSKETVSSIKREDFVNFLNKWYGLHNMVLVLAGDAEVLDSDETLAKVEKYFGKKHDKRAEKRIDTNKLAENEPKFSSKKIHLEKRKTEQAHLVMAWQGLSSSDERRYALSLLGIALGGNMSSRLFTEVREKRGLCYYVHTDTDYYHNTGIFGASAGVDPKRIKEAIKVIYSEFTDIASGKRKITKEELQKAKDYISGSSVLDLEDSRSVAQFFGLKQILSNKIVTPDEMLEKLNKVTLAEVNDIAKELVKKGEAKLAIIGPFEDEKEFLELIS